jgi:hypothetical protein
MTSSPTVARPASRVAVWLAAALSSTAAARAIAAPADPATGPAVATRPAGRGDPAIDALFVRLAAAEAKLDALDDRLRRLAPAPAAKDRPNRPWQGGDDLMGRADGGPAPWTYFYGGTANAFGPAARPSRLADVARAAAPAAAAAGKEVAALAADRDALREAARQVEREQAALWAAVAWAAVRGQELERRPLYRCELKVVDDVAAVVGRSLATAAGAAFVRGTYGSVCATRLQVQADALGAVDALRDQSATSLERFAAAVADAAKLDGLADADRAALTALLAAGRPVAERAGAASRAGKTMTAEPDDDAERAEARGDFQRAMANLGGAFARADAAVAAAARAWNLAVDPGAVVKGFPPEAVAPPPQAAPPAVAAAPAKGPAPAKDPLAVGTVWTGRFRDSPKRDHAVSATVVEREGPNVVLEAAVPGLATRRLHLTITAGRVVLDRSVGAGPKSDGKPANTCSDIEVSGTYRPDRLTMAGTCVWSGAGLKPFKNILGWDLTPAE